MPAPLTAAAKAIAGFRYHLDWDGLDYTGRAARLTTPVLLFHGTADPRIPVATSQAFARARPDLVTFVPVEPSSTASPRRPHPCREVGVAESRARRWAAASRRMPPRRRRSSRAV